MVWGGGQHGYSMKSCNGISLQHVRNFMERRRCKCRLGSTFDDNKGTIMIELHGWNGVVRHKGTQCLEPLNTQNHISSVNRK